MTNWHRESCKRPDVYPAGDCCHCSNCDTLAPLDQVVPAATRFIPALPELPAHGEIHFTWPESVQFWDDQDIPVSSSAAGGEKLGATGICQCYTKADKISRQIQSSASKLRGVYGTLQSTDQIRLLLLSKGSFDDPVHGTLMIAQLSSNVKFQALSYTWADAAGDDSHSEAIFLGPRWDIFMVTANCKAALRRLRRKDYDCMVWVDAICIDQANHSERNHQVGLMRRIYSAASEVFVYLGEVSSLSKEAFQRLMWARKHESVDEKGRQSLNHLFNMRYFHRVWVIQEIANAKSATIHYGGDAVGWSVLEEERLKSLGIYDNVPKWISSIYLGQDYTIYNLSDLLFSTTSSEASDPRDKVFALLGLINDTTEFGLIADYSLSLEEVQVGVSAFVIDHGDDCSILTTARGINSNSLARVPSWVPTWDRRYRSTPIPRGSETFDSYVVLRAEHVLPHVFMKPMLDDLAMAKPRIHHVGGFLSILALKIIDLSRLPYSWKKYLQKDDPNQNFEFFPGLALVLDENADTSKDEIVLLKGCETIFHIRKQKEPNTFKIVGVCNILLSMDRLNRNRSMNILELDLVSYFTSQSCPLERKHLQQMIELETLFRRLGCWDNESYQSTDITLCESMFLDSVIKRVLDIHIMELGLKFSLSEESSSDFKDLETGSQSFLPISLQVQWLTTRLRFWDSQPNWKIVNAFGDIYSKWLDWRRLRAKLEYSLFYLFQTKNSIEGLRDNTRDDIQEMARLTVFLADNLLQLAGPSHIKECRLRFGNLNLLLFQATDSGDILPATYNHIEGVISRLFEQIDSDFFSRKKSFSPGSKKLDNGFFDRFFRKKKNVSPGVTKLDNVSVDDFSRKESFSSVFTKLDDGSFEFTGWDWGGLETLLAPLEPFDSMETRDMREACLSRISLCNLQPQGREWKPVTII